MAVMMIKKERKYIVNKYAQFLSKVNTQNFEHDKCWIWQGATKGNGYGNVRLGDKNITAHRYAYQLFIGEVKDGLDVCHTCDNRFCVNPDHLFLGTRLDNMQDCKNKGRTAGYYRKSITEKQKQEVITLLLNGNNPSVIARAVKLPVATIHKIKRNFQKEICYE